MQGEKGLGFVGLLSACLTRVVRHGMPSGRHLRGSGGFRLLGKSLYHTLTPPHTHTHTSVQTVTSLINWLHRLPGYKTWCLFLKLFFVVSQVAHIFTVVCIMSASTHQHPPPPPPPRVNHCLLRRDHTAP